MNARRVGLIGAGLLGQAIAERLLAAGFEVIGYDRDPAASARLNAISGQAAAQATDIPAATSRIVLCLPDHTVVRTVISEITPHLQPGCVLIDTSTGDVTAAVELERDFAQHGIHYIEATISGSSDHVRHQTALIMTGGDRAVCESCHDLLAPLGRDVLYAGGVGSASRLKLATNLVLGLNRAALAEGLAFAQALGLDAALTLQALRAGVAYSRIMDSKGPKLLAGDFTPQARLSQHEKDVRLMLAAAAECGLSVPLTETHHRLLLSAISAGWGNLDNCAIYRVYTAQGCSELLQAAESAYQKKISPDSWAAQ